MPLSLKSFVACFLFGVAFCFSVNQSIATPMSVQAALAKVKKEKLALPHPNKDGTYQTFNKSGVMNPNLDIISEAFLKEIDDPTKDAFEIGAGFGDVAIKALMGKVRVFTASDLDARHIAILAKRAQDINPKITKRLSLLYGDFPKDYHTLKDASFDAILVARVFHYFSPEQITESMKTIYRILKPGGKIYIVAITPYVKRFESFIPLYKQRLLLKHQYPGYVKNLKYFANQEVTSPEQMMQMHDKPFMFFDAQFMHTLLTDSGFIVQKSIEFPLSFQSEIWQLDGREFVGAIAKKPIQRASFPQ